MENCPTCDGSGEYANTGRRDPLSGAYVDMVDCHVCNGTGELEPWFAEIIREDAKAEQDFEYERDYALESM